MKTSKTESELIRALDEHDQLAVQCAAGNMDFWDFEARYDSLYPRYPLDAHESDAEGLAILAKHERRVALHREIWQQVITKVTRDEFAQANGKSHGFITAEEAKVRLKHLVDKHLR
jgi:hypothetical protein